MFGASSERMGNDAVIVIRGGRIVALGSAATIPANARTIDLGDATLLPGFIDTHSHLTLEPDKNYYRKTLNELLRNPTEMAFYAAANAQRTFRAGFTTVLPLAPPQSTALGLRNHSAS